MRAGDQGASSRLLEWRSLASGQWLASAGHSKAAAADAAAVVCRCANEEQLSASHFSRLLLRKRLAKNNNRIADDSALAN